MLRLEISIFHAHKGVKKFVLKVVFFYVKKDVPNWDTKGHPFVHLFRREKVRTF